MRIEGGGEKERRRNKRGERRKKERRNVGDTSNKGSVGDPIQFTPSYI